MHTHKLPAEKPKLGCLQNHCNLQGFKNTISVEFGGKKPVIQVFEISHVGDIPGGPVIKTLCFHCRGHGFDPWLGN